MSDHAVGDRRNRSDELTDLLAGLARMIGDEPPVQSIVDLLVARTVDVLAVTGAGVLMGAEEVHLAAASNAKILELEILQGDLGEGPCLEACRLGQAVTVPDLSVDERFPRFSAQVRDRGLAAVFSFPMALHGNQVGALDLYLDQPGELDAWQMRAAQILADVATAYIRNAQGQADAADTVDLLLQRSLHDPLTGLANRALFRERLDHAVTRASRSHQVVAVLYVDLDHFKAVNDRFGHHVGDKLLVAVARRLNQIVRGGDTLARLSGDEFVLLCEDLESAESAETVAERIIAALEPAFALDGVRVKVTASVGVAFAGPGEEMPDNLLRDADFAMYQAKQAGGAQHQVLDRGTRAAFPPRTSRR